MEITVELSCYKIPLYTEIPQFWADNKESMITLIELSHMGLRGHITGFNSY